jgi:hypothetical protein
MKINVQFYYLLFLALPSMKRTRLPLYVHTQPSLEHNQNLEDLHDAVYREILECSSWRVEMEVC